MTVICYQVFRSFFLVSFRFQHQLINLAWLSCDFISFSWSRTVCFFVALYSCMCSFPKISQNVFYLWLSTILVVILQSTCLIYKTWKRKQIMEQQLQRTFEWTKSKQKQNKVTSNSSSPRVLLFDLAHKQCNGIIKGWVHCLTSESKGRFLVNNILVFGST